MQLKVHEQRFCFVDASLESDTVDRMLMGEMPEASEQPYATAPRKPRKARKPQANQKRKRKSPEVDDDDADDADEEVLDEGTAAAAAIEDHSEHATGQIDATLLQIARDMAILAQDQDFSQVYPLTAGVIQELVGVVPMRATTPDVLAVLRDIWGQIRSQSEL